MYCSLCCCCFSPVDAVCCACRLKVDEAIDVINKMKDSHVDWREIEELGVCPRSNGCKIQPHAIRTLLFTPHHITTSFVLSWSIPFCYRVWLPNSFGGHRVPHTECNTSLFACLLVCLFACLLACLFACMLACLFVCLLVCLFACLQFRSRVCAETPWPMPSQSSN